MWALYFFSPARRKSRSKQETAPPEVWLGILKDRTPKTALRWKFDGLLNASTPDREKSARKTLPKLPTEGEGRGGTNHCQPQPTANDRLNYFLRFQLSTTKCLCGHNGRGGVSAFSFLSFFLKNPMCAPPRRSKAASATLSSSRSPSPMEAGGSRRTRGGRSRVRAPLPRRGPPRGTVRPGPPRPACESRGQSARRCLPMLRLWRGERGPARGLSCAPAQARRGGASIRPRARSAAPHARSLPRSRQAGASGVCACARGALRRSSRSLPLASAAPAGPPRTHSLRRRAPPARDPGTMHEPVRRALGPRWGEISREWSGIFFFGHAPWGPRAPPRLPQLVPGAVTSRRGRAPPSSRCGELLARVLRGARDSWPAGVGSQTVPKGFREVSLGCPALFPAKM